MSDIVPTERIPLVLRRYMAGLAAHDVDLVGQTVADGLVFFSQTRQLDKQHFLAFLRALYAGFPDWHYEHDPIREPEPDVFVVRWRQSGQHTGRLALPGCEPVSPTGRQVMIPPQDFSYRVAGGLVVEIRPDPTPGGAPRGIFEQIGVALPPL